MEKLLDDVREVPEDHSNELVPEAPKRRKRLSVKQASEEFFEGNVSQGMIYELVKKNEIPNVKLSGGKILLDADALELWWENKLYTPVALPEAEQKVNPQYGTLRKIKA